MLSRKCSEMQRKLAMTHVKRRKDFGRVQRIRLMFNIKSPSVAEIATGISGNDVWAQTTERP